MILNVLITISLNSLIHLSIQLYNSLYNANIPSTDKIISNITTYFTSNGFSFCKSHFSSVSRLKAESDSLNYISFGITASHLKKNVDPRLMLNLDTISIIYSTKNSKYFNHIDSSIEQMFNDNNNGRLGRELKSDIESFFNSNNINNNTHADYLKNMYNFISTKFTRTDKDFYKSLKGREANSKLDISYKVFNNYF